MNLIERYNTRPYISSRYISIGDQLRIVKSEYILIDLNDNDIVTVIDITGCIRAECEECPCGRRGFLLRNDRNIEGYSCRTVLETLDAKLVVE